MIDTLEMLEEKTKGNLTAPETNFLANSLYDLRMGYVRMINSQQTATQEETADKETATTEPDEADPETNTAENSDT